MITSSFLIALRVGDEEKKRRVKVFAVSLSFAIMANPLIFDAEDMFLHQSNFTFYEFDSNFELKPKKEFLISDQIMTHDWVFTDSHYILMANRIKLNLPGSLLGVAGLAPMATTVSSNPNHPTTPIYLLPRFSDESNMKRDWRAPIEAPSQLWTSHVGNAFEKKDGAGNVEIQIQASVASYQRFNFLKMFGNGKILCKDEEFLITINSPCADKSLLARESIS